MLLRELSDKELAKRIVSYIIRCENLSSEICDVLENANKKSDRVLFIREEYKQLKNEIKVDAHELRLRGNDEGSDLFLGFFAPSIKEADAFGFRAPTNHKIDQTMVSSVEDARYKLTKYKSLKRWQELL